MSKISPQLSVDKVRRGRLFSEHTIPQEELARRKAEQDRLYKRCRLIFDKVQPLLIKKNYNWFIVIEPDSSNYVMDADEEIAYEKARQKYPNKRLVAFRLNETGSCGKI
jgi:hypothetical protein